MGTTRTKFSPDFKAQAELADVFSDKREKRQSSEAALKEELRWTPLSRQFSVLY